MDYVDIKWNHTININKNQWKEIFLNEKLIKSYNKELILRIYNKPNHMATASEIAKEQGQSPKSYNSNVGQLGKRLAKYFNIEAPRQKEDNEKYNYWHVMFLGAIQNQTGHFIWILRPELKEAIDELIMENKIETDYVTKEVICIPEEISLQQLSELKEGAKYQITVNAYERNKEARKVCIDYYKKFNNGKIVCQICGFNFRAFYGEVAEGKIHVHHVKSLHEIGEEYEVDAVNDLIPICPNCHLVIHTKEPSYTPEEIRKMLGNNKEKTSSNIL